MKRTLNWPPNASHSSKSSSSAAAQRCSLGFTSAFTTTTTYYYGYKMHYYASCRRCLACCTQETSSSQSSVAKFWVQNASLLLQRLPLLFKTREGKLFGYFCWGKDGVVYLSAFPLLLRWANVNFSVWLPLKVLKLRKLSKFRRQWVVCCRSTSYAESSIDTLLPAPAGGLRNVCSI